MQAARNTVGRVIVAAVAAALLPVGAAAEPGQQRPQPPSIFGSPQPPPAARQPILPPQGSPPLLRNLELRFPAQGNVASVEYDTYLYYMELPGHVSLPSQGRWVPYTEELERVVLDDFNRLWDTGFLDDLWIEVVDEPWPNGVIGKRVIFNMEERQRVKIVTFEGSDELKREDIDLNLEDNGVVLRMDSFLDPAVIQRVKGVLQVLFRAKGFLFSEVDHTIEELPGGPKLVRLTFHMDEGPKVMIRNIDFVGNRALSDGDLKGRMRKVRESWWLSWMTGRGTYKEGEFEEDAEAIVAHYRNEGYIRATVGQPNIEYLELSEDGGTRAINLRIPVDEGERYRLGDLDFAGNEILLEEGLQRIFRNLEAGDYYSEGEVREGFEDARELYGSLGYYEMTLVPELAPRDEPLPGADAANGNGNGNGNGEHEGEGEAEERPTHIDGAPVVDVTIRVQEGEQYFVNRIEFAGNKTTHDEVIRRELQLAENAVFNTEALKYSVRRLNQLGFFEPLEEEGVGIEKTDSEENEVDITFNLSETNLNQLTFGAGVSEFDGFFGQVSFQTTNFMGRGESLQVSMLSGSRARNYQLSFMEPFIFGRPISLGSTVYSRRIEWIGSFTEDSRGATVTFGVPLALFTRMFVGYSLESSEVTDISPYLTNRPELLAFNPFFADALLQSHGGRRIISKVTPSLALNTVDHPIFPTNGHSLTASLELAGLGGNTQFWKPTLEGTWYVRHTSKTIIGLRGQYSHMGAGDPNQIPIFERLWLGGEYSVRGFDIRRIGPTFSDTNADVDANTYAGRMIVGGNKSLLLNAEYQFLVGGPVRLVWFYDAGQVQDFGSRFAMQDFKTSTGIELRFFMPMLNVPFRLIYYWNPQADGVYNDRLAEQERSGFRFSIGTTF